MEFEDRLDYKFKGNVFITQTYLLSIFPLGDKSLKVNFLKI